MQKSFCHSAVFVSPHLALRRETQIEPNYMLWMHCNSDYIIDWIIGIVRNKIDENKFGIDSTMPIVYCFRSCRIFACESNISITNAISIDKYNT